MDLFVEYLDGEYAVCRLPDRDKNLIRLPLRQLPKGVKDLDVVSMRDNGTFLINDYGKEVRMKKISNYLRYRKYSFSIR